MESSVVVGHPGAQHSHHLALGLQRAGLLKAYVTSVYTDWDHAPFSYLSFLPVALRKRIESNLFQRSRRQLAGLKSELVISSGALREAAIILARRVGFPTRYCKRLNQLSSSRFQRGLVAFAQDAAEILVCYDTNAFEAFSVARSTSLLTLVIDQSIAHPAFQERVLSQEKKLCPQFSDSITLPSERTPWFDEWVMESRLADYVIVGSSFVKKTCIDEGVEANRIIVVPYGTYTEAFSPAYRESGDRFRVLFVGSIDQRKGISYLLEACKRLKLPDAELLFCGGIKGSGEGLSRYEGTFTYLGRKAYAEMPDVYRLADVFVLPSLVEGLAQVNLEAMASGVPIITTENSGAGDIIEDGVEGFIIPIRDVEAIQERIVQLYEDRNLCAEMGRAARLKAKEYDWKNYYDRVASAFRHIASQK